MKNKKLKNTKKALKFDDGKPPLDLLPKNALIEVGRVLNFGARKYKNWNWKKGFAWSRLEASALRHLFAYAEGEDLDPESGLSHLGHASCCILFLLTHYLEDIGIDDRYKKDLRVSLMVKHRTVNAIDVRSSRTPAASRRK